MTGTHRDFEIPTSELLESFRSKGQSYQTAEPFPHIVFDKLISEELLEKVLQEFPSPNDIEWRKLEAEKYSHKKLISSDFDLEAGIYTKRLVQSLTSSLFLRSLEELTGIQGLIPDPHLYAAGLHQYETGGFLEIHTDFNYHHGMNLFRRINLILYLNKDWKKEYNGSLILSDRSGQKSVEVFAGWNQMVIANIQPDAYHGFPTPIDCPDDMTRKSLALWYYTTEIPLWDATLYLFDQPHFKGQEKKLGILGLIKAVLPPFLVHSLKKPYWAVSQLIPPVVLYAWYKLVRR